MPAPRILPLTLAALLAAAAAACGSSDDTAAPSAPPSIGSGSSRPSAASPTADPGDTAPVADVLRFSAPRLGGGTIEGEDLAGQDVAFWFWAPW